MKSAARLAMALAAGLAVAPAQGRAADPAALSRVEATLDTMGVGRDVRNLHTVGAKVQSLTFDLVENDHADAPFPVKAFAVANVVDDYRSGLQVTIADGAPRRMLLAHLAQASQATSGEAKPGRLMPPPPSWETQDPLRALLIARQASDLASEPDVVRHGALQHVVSFHNGRWPVRLYIDERLGLPTATEAVVSFDEGGADSVALKSWGDIVDRSEFMLYDLTAGVRSPLQTDIYRNGEHYKVVLRSNPRVDAAEDAATIATTTAPEAAAHFDLDALAVSQPTPGGIDPKRGPEEIAPGVVQLPGSWYSTLVLQNDGVVIIDAPISTGYSRQVIAEAERRFPGVRIKAVITSTPFFWHIAGLREYAARGIPIYGRDRNQPILRALLSAPHSLSPDSLSRARLKPVLRPVSGRLRIGSGRNALEVLPVRYGEQPMVMTYLADARLLHTGEMVQPLGPNGALLFPESLFEVDRTIIEAGIPTDGLRLIGMHMSPTPWTALAPAIAAASGG